MHKINIGLSDTARAGVIELLNNDLSDAYLLSLKTKKCHWDVTGPQFMTLHKLWEEQYLVLTENVDRYAERVRALGGYPVGTAAGFLAITSITEYPGHIQSATGMVEELTTDHELVIRNLRSHIDQCDDKFKDQGTADFLTGIMEQHEEIAWMLRSFIEGEMVESNGKTPSLHNVEVPTMA